ncbi:sulfurtransferase complex subunit TusC [Avibacterium paragallinarum]|uniref:sulfurtransferase complex subunit TusC n=1 Tax=Avibacterium paragallinarum TaxID=728 RepID=UPI00021ACF3D|nr:sulfurtransferase complex subunit TusC [Avibacterium paragallinarum]AZI15058.1 sulfurtransferase complex subunit TusC [Avibacterium paragallinarum]QIR12490.1 sulfurtransferase complex subunit TusC [Avibacterium paragallinarum]QJE10555.1 sulfurtransferase complex subunit TusC [Avibacterium paragallinarum]QJE12748.1 sulfurtransferase complex subunit TusC [Avibacterium paragallinarum]QJE14950.1 sulfurtransferase complex subunit TusC [Avibacterium paragallinarum]
MIKLAFVFTQAPYGTATSREGLDALLAATAFCDESEIAVFFLDDGVFNILANQQSEQILQKNFTQAFKLLDLYDIEQRYLCHQSVQAFQLEQANWLLDCEILPRSALIEKLQQAEKVLTF